MNLVSWLKKYNCSPIDLLDLAESLNDVKDSPALTGAARAYRAAEATLRMELAKAGHEPG